MGGARIHMWEDRNDPSTGLGSGRVSLLTSRLLWGMIDDVIDGLRMVNASVEGTGLSKIPEESRDRIVHED